MAKDTITSKTTSLEDLSAQIDILKNDIATLTSSVGEYGKEKGRTAANSARSSANDLATSGRVKALEAQDAAEDFVREQPATALGIAAGLGFLVGLIATRR